MKRLRILTLVAILLAAITYGLKNNEPTTLPAGEGLLVDRSWLITKTHPQIPKEDIRPADQTFLTFPEWFLVFSPAEQADYFRKRTSSSFPYLTHVDQMWAGYRVMYDQIKGIFPFNTGYHMMIMVIAGSTTVEYSIKSFYETIIGRITDTDPLEKMTAEDEFNAAYEESYVKFIEALPWYEYNFNAQLKLLWTNIPFQGPHLLRKLERRYYLSTELLVKSCYGWLIGLGTKSAYETASLQTKVVLDKGAPNALLISELPRYAGFADAACTLAQEGVSFREIAGNTGAIMVSILSTEPLDAHGDYKVLFTQPVITRPRLKRIALVTTVGKLSTVLKKLMDEKRIIEHVYDY